MAQVIDFASRKILADEPSAVEENWDMDFYEDPKNAAMIRCEFYVNQQAADDLHNAFWASMMKQAREIGERQRS
jgi:hypothetical protein